MSVRGFRANVYRVTRWYYLDFMLCRFGVRLPTERAKEKAKKTGLQVQNLSGACSTYFLISNFCRHFEVLRNGYQFSNAHSVHLNILFSDFSARIHLRLFILFDVWRMSVAHKGDFYDPETEWKLKRVADLHLITLQIKICGLPVYFSCGKVKKSNKTGGLLFSYNRK